MTFGNRAYDNALAELVGLMEDCSLLPHIEAQKRQGHGRGVTLKMLWEEYCDEHPEGYWLTQFN